jgi:hypothetical protein
MASLPFYTRHARHSSCHHFAGVALAIRQLNTSSSIAAIFQLPGMASGTIMVAYQTTNS